MLLGPPQPAETIASAAMTVDALRCITGSSLASPIVIDLPPLVGGLGVRSRAKPVTASDLQKLLFEVLSQSWPLSGWLHLVIA